MYNSYGPGDQVDVYWNIRKRVFSIRKNYKVVAHVEHLELLDSEFLVSEKGRTRVRMTGVKNVHAVIRGTIRNPGGLQGGEVWDFSNGQVVTYNPYRDLTFVNKVSGESVKFAQRVELKIVRGAPVITIS